MPELTDDLAGARTPAPHAWQRYLWLWDAYFAAVAVFTVVFIQLEGRGAHPWPPARGLASLLVVGLAAWYAGFGRTRMRQQPPAGRRDRIIYQAVVFALFAPAVLLNGAAEIGMFALIPQVFTIWPPLAAVAITGLLYATAFAASLLRGQGLPSLDQLPGIALGVAVILILSLVLTVYIRQIAGQSTARAELVEALAASRAEVARLSHAAGVAAERHRLAGDIHDTVAQGLSSVVMLVQAADAALERDPATARAHLSLAERTARENLAETRALVAALTPAVLDGATLPDALTRLAGGATLPATVSVEGPARPLPTAVEVVLLRAAQESLTNVARPDILPAVEAGATGYLLKDATRGDLLHAVRAAARGETVLAPSVAARLLHRVRHPAPVHLSAREVEVLRLVAHGLSNAEIGRELHISAATVKTHLLRCFAKLEVSDRTAAVTTAMRHGLLDPPLLP